MENKMIEAAMRYLDMGISVFPVNPNTKKPLIASWKKYQTEYATKEEVTKWFGNGNGNGIAIVTGKISNLFVVDFDKYKSNYSEDIALSLIPDTVVAPTARTMSGGQHIYFRNPDGNFSIRADIAPGIDYRGEGGYVVAPPTENMIGGQYVWETSLDDCPPPAVPESFINALLNKDIKNIYTHGDDNQCRQVSTSSTSVYTVGRRDQDLFSVANALVKQRCDDQLICKTLEILALNCTPPFPLHETEIKIKSAIERANRRERNLAEEVREFVMSTNGVFLSTEVVKSLQLSTRDERKNLSIILKRLEKNDKLIEKHGNRNGCYRTIDQDEEVIDFMAADMVPFDIKFPLGLQEYVSIHKGNVIIVAGESNAGKSAFCLNVAKMNCDIHKVNYMSSEMQDGTELKIRIIKFGDHLDTWKKIKFTFRTDNFPDKIDPDGLNIIDYLDEGTDSEAYKMPMRIRLISDRLKSGVAVIAIQKDPNKGLGFGGSGTLNRSRLYVTLSRAGILKIEKGKIWRQDNINPNGMFCSFKLLGGAKFSKDGEWKC